MNVLAQKSQQEKNLKGAFSNYQKIANKNLSNKFSYLDEWLYKKSSLLLDETTNCEKTGKNNKKLSRTFKRGTIIKVDFGVNIGSEMSQIHFAIVITKDDNPNVDTITVIPLTSKESEFNIPLNYNIFSPLIKEVNDFLHYQEIDKRDLRRELSSKYISKSQYNRKYSTIAENIKEINSVLTYYSNHNKVSYACITQIRNISKSRIIMPVNAYDKLEKIKCPDSVMDDLDRKILDRFTNYKSVLIDE